MGASLSYNSQSAVDNGLGAGWLLSAGDDLAAPPAKLIDHSVSGVTPELEAVERVSGDGSSDYYTRVGSSKTYVAAPGDGSQLTKNENNSWTLLDADGAIYSFGAAGTDGIAKLSSAEIVDAARGSGALTYTYGANGRISSIDAGSGRTLTFSWGCTTPLVAILCVTGPDSVTWSYIGDASGRIVKVNDGVRDLVQIAYDGNGRLNSIKNANDLDPSHASPGYNGAHALTVSYDTSGRVATVNDGPTSNQSPTTSTWSFGYYPGSATATTVRASHYDQLVLNDAPATLVPLNESGGTSASDVSGNGNGGTYSGAYTLNQAGALAGSGGGSSVSFAGGTVTGSVSAPQLNLAAGATTTVEFWMNWNGTSGVMPFGFNLYALYLVNGNFGFNTGCSDLYGTTAPSANAWHHVVAQFVNGVPSAGAKLWIDGTQRTLSQLLGSPCSRTVTSSFRIAGWPYDAGYRFGGKIDELAIYPDALTSAAIKAHYDEEGLHNRPADGYTTLTPPLLQGQPCTTTPFKCVKTYYDSLGHPIETRDPLGKITMAGYNARDELLWSEDADGNPTDYLYGGPDGKPTSNQYVPDVLLQTTGPDPDGAGALGRTVARSRYDETQIGNASAAGAPLQGLQAAYFDNPNLAGRAKLMQTDPNVDFTWTSTGPPGLGQPNNFSVRWTGDLVVTSAGSYSFSTPNSYKGTRLTIDGTRVLDNWTSSSPAQAIVLASGLHRLVLEYWDDAALTTPQVHLWWSCAGCAPAVANQVIPGASLRPAWFNKTSSVSPAGRISFSHYADPADAHPDYELVKLADGTPLITSYSYDSYGRATQKVMPKGNAARTIDAQGNLTGPSPDTNYATDYNYYGPGEPAAPPAAPGCAGGSVNQSELLKSKTPHGLATTTFVYDLAGRAIAETKGAGTTCSNYDNEGRLVSTRAPSDSQATTYAYDPAGAQRSASDASGTVSSDYDEQGRLVHSVDSYGAEAIFRYDADGNQICRAAAPGSLGANPACGSSGYTTTYSYDDNDRLTKTTDPAGHRYDFFYDNRGNLHAIQYQAEAAAANQTFAWFDYNAAGWLTAVYNRHGSLPLPLPASVPADAQGNPLVDFVYGYNNLDGLKTQETRTAGGLPTQTTNYVYDLAGRLSQVTLPNGTCRNYLFDLDSNRTRIDESLTGCSGTFAQGPAYSYSTAAGLDQLTSVGSTTYTYDSDGRMRTRGGDNITWDGWDRMTGGTFGTTTVSYLFDALGRRRLRMTTNPSKTISYLFDGAQDSPLFQTDGTGAVTQTYVQAGGFDLAHYVGPPTSGSTIAFLYYNGHGDLSAEASATGARTSAYTYDPFGGPTGALPQNSTVERWAGRWDKQLDTTTNFIQMGVRPFDPAIGRFLAVDPVDGGSFNLYDYAFQDPINVFDLTGKEPPGTCPRFGKGSCGHGRGSRGRSVPPLIRLLQMMVAYWNMPPKGKFAVHYTKDHNGIILRRPGKGLPEGG